MGRRLALVLAVGAALAASTFAGAAGSASGGAKFKLRFNTLVLSCNTSCGQHPFETLRITRLDDDHHSCVPSVDFSNCRWTARAGTKVVLQTTDSVEPTAEVWGGDASCTGTKCAIVADSDKSITLSLTFP